MKREVRKTSIKGKPNNTEECETTEEKKPTADIKEKSTDD